MKKSLLISLLFLQSTILFAVNYTGQEQQFKQPDGSLVTVRLYGSEYYMRAESIDSFTVVRDQNSKWISYAKLSADGKKLVATGLHYTGKKGEAGYLKLEKHLDIPLAEKKKIIKAAQQKLGGMIGHDEQPAHRRAAAAARGTPVFPVSGNITGLCIVVDFSDEPGTLPITEYEDFCNKLTYNNYGNNGSLRTFYSDISGGLLNYENQVFGYFRAPHTFAYYDALPYAEGARQILGAALAWIDAAGFDFSTLTIEPDGRIKAINLMYTGHPPTWAQGMWHHQGSYEDFTADGVSSGRYNTSPAYEPLQIGTVCHENGHMIGHWPDTYKYTNTTGVDGIGNFDLMCGVGASRTNPVPPNPLFLSNVGWMSNIDVTNYNGIRQDTSNSLSCYKYRNVNDTAEFFLLKSYQKAGRGAGFPGDGLTIWHIDRKGDNQTTHHEVYLEHARGAINGNHATAGFKAPAAKEFGRTTTPAAAFYNGDYNALHVWDISTAGTYMNYTFGAPTGDAALKLMRGGITNDGNGNGFAEPGETADLIVTPANFGTTVSGPVTITTVPADSSSAYVTVNTPVYQAGAIAAGSDVHVPVSLTVKPATPLGTRIVLLHTATDDTAVIMQEFTVGNFITMGQAPATACSALFFDAGGADANYEDNADVEQTITASPGATALTATFTEFNIEEEDNCAWDYLEVYDGTSTAAPLIGRYCGVNLPAAITSTNAAAALTFKFHSDEITNESGWKATLSCDAPTGIRHTASAGKVNLYPNPTTGIIHINVAESSVITVTDLIGKFTGITGKVQPGAATLDLSGLPAGVYMIRAQSASGTRYGKVTLDEK